jgi:DNA-directed RNA polymerase delta subunit
MLHAGEPLHFNEISERINKGWKDARDVKTATVHNELIFDDRFVLVGRGMYGLKDWGFATGSVEDVIVEYLKEKGEVNQKDLIEYVKDKKMVKDATVKLALKNKDKFIKENGTVKLAA